jgi:hypothetical protein
VRPGSCGDGARGKKVTQRARHSPVGTDCGLAVEMQPPALPVRRLAPSVEWWTDVNRYRRPRRDADGPCRPRPCAAAGPCAVFGGKRRVNWCAITNLWRTITRPGCGCSAKYSAPQCPVIAGLIIIRAFITGEFRGRKPVRTLTGEQHADICNRSYNQAAHTERP